MLDYVSNDKFSMPYNTIFLVIGCLLARWPIIAGIFSKYRLLPSQIFLLFSGGESSNLQTNCLPGPALTQCHTRKTTLQA